MPKRPKKRCRFLLKDAFLGFLRSVLADPKTVQARDTSSEPVLSISWCGSDMRICFGACRKGAARGGLHPPCGVGRSGSACQTQTMKCSECVQRTCLWVVQFLDRPKRTSGSRETRLCTKKRHKSGTGQEGAKRATRSPWKQEFWETPCGGLGSARFQLLASTWHLHVETEI